EPNHNRLKGNFMINVLSQALPAALSVVIYILLISAFTSICGYDDTVRSTMCVILTGVCSLTALQRVCVPFTRQRRILFYTLTLLFLLAVVFLKELFMIARLDWLSLFVCIGGSLAVMPFMTWLDHVLHRFEGIRKRIIEATQQD
ncbi:MAG: cation-translocating P-type ATPase, partial [Erysipelotrichaceae bacterium]|nr:cation-translocating P-type ATPase [Erysipelotrichaceae bacterium]